MFWGRSPRQRASVPLAIELGVCACLVAVLAVYGLYRMDYLDPATAHHIRMTDSTRTAYVAKNIAEGRGYTTNELPTFLIDFYDQRGKLHGEWPNADRFPFTAYAVAALYVITQSTSDAVGILGYNLLTFVGFLVLLYWLTRVIWNDKWPAVFALGIALLHPTTYLYLYLKDADMMLLTTGVLLCFYRYFQRPERMTHVRAIVMGTALAWLMLDRPNIGGGFILCFGALVLLRVLKLRREKRLLGALREVTFNEGTVFVAIVVWCLPFVIYSLSEWGTPFFSANALYQTPLGTRFAMNTDTWWKYSEPGHPVTLGTLLSSARDQVIAKFTTSWVVTLKVLISAYALELCLGIGMLAWLARRARTGTSDPAVPQSEVASAQNVRRLGAVVGATVLINFALLPLYGYQNYGYRHYLSFFLPFIWLMSGQAVIFLARRIWPVAKDVLSRIRATPGPLLLVVVVGLLAWNVGTRGRGQQANYLFVRTADFFGTHWLAALTMFAGILGYRLLFRLRPFHRAVLIVSVVVFARYQPYLETKRLNQKWFPADIAVWNKLRERSGMVMSFAMQSEVNWVSNRKNLPAPEFVMHAYNLLYDHKLEIEDVYIESAEGMLDSWDGPFYYAAPGFESYVRMQKFHGRLPGYEIVFDAATSKGYPKFDLKPRPKASTVYRLVDREAVKAMAHSPTKLELGSVDDVVYTAHGWGDYYTIDDRPVVAATNSTHRRYVRFNEKPWEDTSTTFFLDDRRPTSVDLDIYAPHATTLQFYWNLDLYYYDAANDRAAHQVGTYKVTAPGWQVIHLDIPRNVTRVGFNKLGFKASTFHPVAVCPPTMTEMACTQIWPEREDPKDIDTEPMIVLRDPKAITATPMRVSVFVKSLGFHYDASEAAH
jgi:hypothetical protein